MSITCAVAAQFIIYATLHAYPDTSIQFRWLYAWQKLHRPLNLTNFYLVQFSWQYLNRPYKNTLTLPCEHVIQFLQVTQQWLCNIMVAFFSTPDQVWPARVAFKSFLNVSGTKDSRFLIVSESTGWEQKRSGLAMRKCCCGRGWLASTNQMAFVLAALAPAPVRYTVVNKHFEDKYTKFEV